MTSGTPEIRWLNTTSVSINLSFKGSKAICGACVIGNVNATGITGTAVLSRKNSNGTYTAVKKWRNLYATGNMLFFDKIYYVSKDHTYRLTITSMVYKNGIGEKVTGYYEADA